MCQLRLFLFLHALTLSFSLSLFVCFGSVQLFELLHIVFNIKRILIFFSWSRVYIIYMRSYSRRCVWLFVVNIFHINCQMQYTRIFRSILSYIIAYLPYIYVHIRTTCKTNFTSDLFSSRLMFFFSSHSFSHTSHIRNRIAKNVEKKCVG